jgi:hypothetical protein
VRSRLERACVAFLEEQGIRYQYEPLLLLAGRQYRPDFFLPDYGLFLEICGYTHMPFYCDRLLEKEAVYRKQGLKVAFLRLRRGCEVSAALERILA